jgi:hypothetical protein
MGRSLARWMFAKGAVVGRSHDKMGTPCQDSVGATRNRQTVVLALADGAGSARHSEVGARLAVETTLQLLSHHFDELETSNDGNTQHRIIDAVLSRLREEAASAGVEIHDCASTLLFVAVKGSRFIVGHLGDGVVACERDGRGDVLSHPLRGEHANETVFVTSRNAVDCLSLISGDVAPISSFALMSDGSAESLYLKRDGSLAPALRSIWSWLDKNAPGVVDKAIESNLRDLLSSQTGDDCSLGILRRVGLPATQIEEQAPTFQHAFLDCQSRRGLGTRLSILRAITDQSAAAVAEITKRTGLSASTVRRHAAFLREMLGETPGDTQSDAQLLPARRPKSVVDDGAIGA